MKIVALPRSPNPYQQLFYQEFERGGHAVRYACELTRSHTLNLILLPAELAVYRLSGWRVLHIHWVYVFGLPGSDRLPFLRRVAEFWFGFVLTTCRLLRVRVLWTAHNVLPHERVFHDELAARRRLVRSSDVVLAHSRATLEALEALGMTPTRGAVVPHGPMLPGLDASVLRPPGAERTVMRLLFFGQIRAYKGVEDLLEVMGRIPPAVPVRLLVAGHCADPALRQRLWELAEPLADRVQLMLEEVPDREVTGLIVDSDVVVLPFREATTSGSALLAMAYGRVLVLPDLPAFAALPRDSVVFYDGSLEDLARVITDLAGWGQDRLGELGATASAYASSLSWSDTADQALAAISS